MQLPATAHPWTKVELLRRLTHIQRLAKQENYTEIERLLHERYV
jgi:hypothetical protein